MHRRYPIAAVVLAAAALSTPTANAIDVPALPNVSSSVQLPAGIPDMSSLVESAVPGSTDQAQARAIHAEVNAHRAANGLPPLTWADGEYPAAKAWADGMRDRGTVEHSGGNFVENVGATGYSPVGGGYGSAVDGMRTSPAHNANLLSGDVHSSVVAVSHGDFSGAPNSTYCVWRAWR